MNTYNDNLRASVVSSLDTIEKDIKSTKSKLDAAMITLYHADGSKITANNKYLFEKEKFLSQSTLNLISVNNSNMASNLLATATKEKDAVAHSVTNSAIAAANVQVAANAILKLASDVGSMLSIVSAADYGTEVFDQTTYANQIMKKTAYSAELASQVAMEASAMTATVSATTVADKAMATNQSIADLLAKLSANMKATHEKMEASGKALDAASELERKSEGNLEDLRVEYLSLVSAYNRNLKELNLDLKVIVNGESSMDPEEGAQLDDSEFLIKFKPLLSPFKMKSLVSDSCDDDDSKKTSYEPVDFYKLFIVKDSRKSTFELSYAESISDSSMYKKVKANHSKMSISCKQSELKDAHGDWIEKGESYVVFILAEITKEYKKIISNYEDFLSAGSASFKLTNKLMAVKKIRYDQKEKLITFVPPKANSNVAYRCMFLPAKMGSPERLFTANYLTSNYKKINESKHVLTEILRLESKIGSLNSQKGIFNFKEEKDALSKNIGNAKGTSKKELEEELDSLEQNHKMYLKVVKQLDEYQKRKDQLDAHVTSKVNSSIGFYFNKSLATQVTSANYKLAEKDEGKNEFCCSIDENTTDNFGNRLTKGMKYIPVVLSMSAAREENIGQYENAISNFENTAGIKLL